MISLCLQHELRVPENIAVLGVDNDDLINAGLTIEHLNEFDKGYYAVTEDWYREGDYWYPPGGPPRHPLLFSLKARKR